MILSIQQLTAIVVFSPLLGSVITGFFGKALGRRLSHRIAISLVGVSLAVALLLCIQFNLLTIHLRNLFHYIPG